MTFDEWFDSYAQTYSKDQWRLSDAWNAAVRAERDAAIANNTELEGKLE